MKYIIIEIQNQMDPSFGKEFPIIFPEEVSHRDVARMHHVGKQTLKSAGFCVYDPKSGWIAVGKSESTGFESRPQDSELLNEHMETPYDRLNRLNRESKQCQN